MTRLFVELLEAYGTVGLLFAIPFVWVGVGKVDAHAARGTWGFRLLIIPGTVLLWPWLARRWIQGTGVPPTEQTAHRKSV